MSRFASVSQNLDWSRMYSNKSISIFVLLSINFLPSKAVRCLMCASYAGTLIKKDICDVTLFLGSNPACEAGTLHQASGVVSATCPGSLPWTDGCKVMVFKVPRIGDIWTRGCCGGIFPKCEDSSSHFTVARRYLKHH